MEFITIKNEVQAEIIVKKSRFIANLFPVQNLEEAEEIIKRTKKKYYDARHNCVAYRIVKENQIIEKSSDDGEPSGTAGQPMLNIFQKNNIANVLVINTRYFGGTLLGTGGLVRAYTESLQKAIEKSEKIQKCQGYEMLVLMDYNEYNQFKYYCRDNNIFMANVEYGEYIECRIELNGEKKQKLEEDFNTKSIILKKVKELDKKYITKSI